MGRRRRWRNVLVLALAMILLLSVIPTDLGSLLRAEDVQAVSEGEEGTEEGGSGIQEIKLQGNANSETGVSFQNESEESENLEETENSEEAKDPEDSENPDETDVPEAFEDSENPDETEVPGVDVSGNEPEIEEEPDAYTEDWADSMTPEELEELEDDEVGAAVWLNGGIAMFAAVARDRADWTLDAYYIGWPDSRNVYVTENFSLKYQMEFHTDVNMPKDTVEIRIPAALVNYRTASGSPTPSAIAIPEGTPDEPVATKNSPFNYYIDKKNTTDQSKWELVFFNYKNIPAGTSAAWQVLYKNLQIMSIADGARWEKTATITVTTPGEEAKLDVSGNELSPAVPETTETKETEALCGEADSMIQLTSVSKEPYASGKSYTPGLYTESQVKQFAGLTELPSWCAGDNFDKYWYAVWRISVNGKATQPWDLSITDTPKYTDGKVGSSERSGRIVGQAPQGISGSSSDDLRQTYVVVAAYEKLDGVKTPILKNNVSVTMTPRDGKDKAQTKTASAQWSYKDYEWNYKVTDVIESEKTNTYASWDQRKSESLKGAMELCSYSFAKDEDYGSFAFSTYGYAHGYGMTHVTPVPSSDKVTAYYQIGTGHGALGDYVNGTSYELITMDDFTYAHYDNGDKDMLSGDDYYFTKVTVSRSDTGYDVWEDTTADPQSTADIRAAQNDQSIKDVDQYTDIYVMYRNGDDWELVKSLDWNKRGVSYTLTDEDLKVSEGNEPYRVMVKQRSINYSTSCWINVEVNLRHDGSSKIAQKMKEYRTENGTTSLRLHDISAAVVYRYDENGEPRTGNFYEAQEDEDSLYEEVHETELELYQDEFFIQKNAQIFRTSASKTLYGIEPFASASKTSKSSNDVVNGRVEVTYTLTGKEGYNVFSKDAVDALKATAPDREDYPDRKKVVFCDLLPYGMRFDPSSKVTAGRLISSTNNESWDSTQVTVSVDSQNDIIDNYRGTGRTMVMFHVEYAGADPSVYTNGQWMSGFGVSFKAYYDWKDLNVAGAASNICAYMPEKGDTRELLSAGRTGSRVCKDDGEGSWDEWSASEKKFYEAFKGGNIRELSDADYEATKELRNVLYARDGGASGDFVIANEADIKKLVRADEDRFGVYAESAVVEPGKGYTYDLTVSNHGEINVKGIVVYDRLENSNKDRKGIEKDPNHTYFDNNEPVWTGTFDSVVTTGLKERGISPVIYYSANRNAPTSENDEDPSKILTVANGWYPAEQFVADGRTLKDVKAVAVDLRKTTAGKDFALGNMDSVTFQIKMTAPKSEDVPLEASYAFNNAAVYSVQEYGGEASQKVGDSVRVQLSANGVLEVKKEFTNEGDVPASLKNSSFTFFLSQGSEEDPIPFANKEYELWTGDVKNEDRLYATDADGSLTLRAGERAVFRNVPDPKRVRVTEKENPFWEVTTDDTTNTVDGADIRSIAVKNAYRPVLYAQKTLEGVPADVDTGSETFTFRIEADGVPLRNAEFWYVNQALLDGSVPSKVTQYGKKGVGKTDENGEFQIKAGQVIALFPGKAGTKYALTEIIPEDTKDKTWDWVCTDNKKEGTVASKGNQETITNYYRWKELLLTKKITHQEKEDYEAAAPEFTFSIGQEDTKNGELEKGASDRIEWVLLDENGEPAGEWKKLEPVKDEDGKKAGMGLVSACAGKTIRIRGLEQGKTYLVTELTEKDALYRPLENEAEVTMPVHSTGTTATITNDYLLRPLTVKKTVVYDQADSAKTEELKTKEFTMTVTIGENPLADQPYILKAQDGSVIAEDPEHPHRTDENGSFPLKNGQTALFKDAGMLGETYEVIETPDEDYPQIFPVDNGVHAGVLSGDGTEASFINGEKGNLLISKEYVWGDEAGKAYVEKIKTDSTTRSNAKVELTLQVTNSSGNTYTWPNISSGSSKKLQAVDQTTGTTSYIYWYGGRSITIEPWKTIVIPESYLSGVVSYALTESDTSQHKIIDQGDGSFLQVSQKSPAGDSALRGTLEENPLAVITNEVIGVKPDGSRIEKRMALGSYQVPEGAELVWRLEKYEKGRWNPAEGADYLIMDGDGKVACDRVLTTGEDGEILLKKPANGYPQVWFVSETVRINRYGTDVEDGELRLVELPEKSGEEWGELIGYGRAGEEESIYAMDLDYEEAVAFVNSSRTTPVEIEKKMSTASDETFTMILKQVRSTETPDAEEEGEEQELQILESVARQGIPYTVYDTKTKKVVEERETGKNGEILLRAGQYARLNLPDKTSWTVSEEQKANVPLKEMSGQKNTPDRLTKLEDNLMLIHPVAETIPARLEVTPKIRRLDNNAELKKEDFTVKVLYSDGVRKELSPDEYQINKTGTFYGPQTLNIEFTWDTLKKSIDLKVAGTKYLSNSDVTNGVVDADSGEKVVLNSGNVTIPEYIVNSSGSEYKIVGISYDAFRYNCGGLTGVIIPDSVTDIQYRAFYGCSSLKSVSIPDSVTSIGDNAFYNCDGLKNITIPNSVTSISNSAFNSCDNLETIIVDKPKDSIANAPWSSPYATIIWNDGTVEPDEPEVAGEAWISQTDVKNLEMDSNGKVVVPKYIERDGKKYLVTGIARNAFYNNSNLKSVEIPDSVKYIGYQAFAYCRNLTSINFPDGLTSIDYSAFYECNKLSNITLPESLTSIGNYAFYNCYNMTLTDVTLPESLTSIDHHAFYNCDKLTSIVIPDSVTSIGTYAFYGCDGLASVMLSKGLTSISDGVFSSCTKLESIEIPDGVTSIGYRAFDYCIKLASVTIPDSVTSIGSCAFRTCSSLTSIVIPDGVKIINSETFSGCSSLASISIPDSVTTIYSYAFSGCSSLPEITLPENLTSIGNYAFQSCSKLTSIFIPDKVTSISNWAFSSCSNLRTITINKAEGSISGQPWNAPRATVVWNSGSSDMEVAGTIWISKTDVENGVVNAENNETVVLNKGDVVIPAYIIRDEKKYRVTYISDYAFSGCSNVTSITIPDGVTRIGYSAFSNCSSLTSVTIPDSVTIIDAYAFSGCSSLTSIKIPAGMTSIASSAFRNWTGLTNITIPERITSIGDYAFSGCSNLTSIEIPDGVKYINSYTFQSCSKLASVTIPDSVTTIYSYAFSGCSSLTSIEIPAGMTSIYSYAFSGCSSLTSIEIPAGMTSIGSCAFYGWTGLTSITIPEGIKSIGYSAFSGCSNLTSIDLPDSVTSISYNAFYGCSSLTEIVIPSKVTYIDDYTFYGCSSLKSVTIPDGVTYIDYNAFENCKSLTEITLPSKLTYIDSYAFRYCSSLTSITIPDKVSSINYQTFYGCSSLTEITIPSSVTSINSSAFGNCSSLETITIDKPANSISGYGSRWGAPSSATIVWNDNN